MPTSTKVPVGYKQTDIGVVPTEWQVGPTISLLTLQRGFDIIKSDVEPGSVPVISSSGIAYYHNVHQAKPPGLVIGRKGKLGSAFLVNEPYWPHDTTLWVKDFKGNDPSFLRYFLLFLNLERLDAASAVPTLNRNVVHALRTAFPPTKAEQEAIAEALSDADALIESLEQLIAKKRLIKQGAMQELLTGKKRLPGFEGDELLIKTELGSVPSDWKIKKMGDIGEAIIGLTYSPNQVDLSGTLVLRSSNIQNNRLSFEDNVYVKGDIPDKVIVKEGDLLICVRNGSRRLIGKCALIDTSTQGAAFGAFMALFRCSCYQYICHLFQSNIIGRQISEILGATINQITNADLKSFKIPFPPTIEEQTAIANILTDMDNEIAALEAKLAKARQIKQGMMQELLTGKTRLI